MERKEAKNAKKEARKEKKAQRERAKKAELETKRLAAQTKAHAAAALADPEGTVEKDPWTSWKLAATCVATINVSEVLVKQYEHGLNLQTLEGKFDKEVERLSGLQPTINIVSMGTERAHDNIDRTSESAARDVLLKKSLQIQQN